VAFWDDEDEDRNLTSLLNPNPTSTPDPTVPVDEYGIPVTKSPLDFSPDDIVADAIRRASLPAPPPPTALDTAKKAGGLALEGFSKIVGAPKRAVDWLARKGAEVAVGPQPEGTTAEGILRESLYPDDPRRGGLLDTAMKSPIDTPALNVASDVARAALLGPLAVLPKGITRSVVGDVGEFAAGMGLDPLVHGLSLANAPTRAEALSQKLLTKYGPLAPAITEQLSANLLRSPARKLAGAVVHRAFQTQMGVGAAQEGARAAQAFSEGDTEEAVRAVVQAALTGGMVVAPEVGKFRRSRRTSEALNAAREARREELGSAYAPDEPLPIDSLPEALRTPATEFAVSLGKRAVRESAFNPLEVEFPPDLAPHRDTILQQAAYEAASVSKGHEQLSKWREEFGDQGPIGERFIEDPSGDPGTFTVLQRAKVNGETRIVGGARVEGGGLKFITGGKAVDSPVSARAIYEVLDTQGVRRNDYLSPMGVRARRRFAEEQKGEEKSIATEEPSAVSPELVPAPAYGTEVEVPRGASLRSPIKGQNGSSIVGYEWRSVVSDVPSAREGGLVSRRVSDWERSGTSEGTGREIVHVFYVRHPDGTVTAEGIGSANKILGIDQPRLRSIASREQQAQGARVKESEAILAEYAKRALPTEEESRADWRKRMEANAQAGGKPLGLATLIEKDGRYLRLPTSVVEARREMLESGGWKVAKPAYATEKSSAAAPPPPPRSVGPGYFSQLRSIVDDPRTQSTQTGEQWSRFLSDPKRQVKKAEIEDTGLGEWLKGKAGERVTKKEVQDYLDQNEVRVEEVVKGAGQPDTVGRFDPEVEGLIPGAEEGARVTGGGPEFSQWQEPGGNNYRELLLTLPKRGTSDYYKTYDNLAREMFGKSSEDLTREELSQVEARFEKARQEGRQDFTAGHYSEPNVLAHIRFNERTDADGKRVLFIEEIQSDWAQKGRKEGFSKGITEAERREKSELMSQQNSDRSLFVQIVGKAEIRWRKDPRGMIAGAYEPTTSREDIVRLWLSPDEKVELDILQDRRVRVSDRLRELESLPDSIPSAPFVTSTSTWTDLATKRILRWAADNGFDRVAWTPGEMQAKRYDLSKQLDEIRYKHYPKGIDEPESYSLVGNKGGSGVFSEVVPSDKLEDFVGKDIAEKIRKGEGEVSTRGEVTGEKEPYRVLSGLDLQVGGEGMKGYYDEIVPQSFERVGKKWGVKRGETRVGTGEETVNMDELQNLATVESESGSADVASSAANIASVFVRDRERVSLKEIKSSSVYRDEVSSLDRSQRNTLNRLLEMATEPTEASVHSIDLPPSLRSEVSTKGLPLYRAEGEVTTGKEFSPRTPAFRSALLSLFPDNTYIKEGVRGYTISLPDRRTIRITPDVDSISIDTNSFQEAYGRALGPKERAVGVTYRLPNSALVEMVQGADPRVLYHEHWHVIRHLGNLSEKQLAKLETLYPGEEAQAEAFAKWKESGRPTHTVFTKIWNALRSLYRMVTGGEKSKEELAGEVFGEVEREGLKGTPTSRMEPGVHYATAPDGKTYSSGASENLVDEVKSRGNSLVFRLVRNPEEASAILAAVSNGNPAEGFRPASTIDGHALTTKAPKIARALKKGAVPIFSTPNPTVAVRYENWTGDIREGTPGPSANLFIAIEHEPSGTIYESSRLRQNASAAHSARFEDAEQVIDARSVKAVYVLTPEQVANIRKTGEKLDTLFTRGAFKGAYRDRDAELARANIDASLRFRPPVESLGRPFTESPVKLDNGLEVMKGQRVRLQDGTVATLKDYRPANPNQVSPPPGGGYVAVNTGGKHYYSPWGKKNSEQWAAKYEKEGDTETAQRVRENHARRMETGDELNVPIADIVATWDKTTRKWVEAPKSSVAYATEAPAPPGSPERSENFRRWFGESKVVDEKGAPKAVYHGTTAQFTKFDPNLSGGNQAYNHAGGMFFTDDPNVAGGYAQYNGSEAFKSAIRKSNELEAKFLKTAAELEAAADSAINRGVETARPFLPERPNNQIRWANQLLDDGVISREQYDRFFKDSDAWDAAKERADALDVGGIADGANVQKSYLKLQNPMEYDAIGQSWDNLMPVLVPKAKELGRDGLIVKNVVDTATGEPTKSTVYVVFDPSQIKSATGNRGTFSPESADIRYATEAAPAPPTGEPAPGAPDAPGTREPVAVSDDFGRELSYSRATGTPPRVETRVESLKSAISEQRSLGIPTPDLILDRDTRRTWKSLDPEIQKGIREWDDEKMLSTLKRRHLDDIEVQVADAVVRGKRDRVALARDAYLEAKGSGDPQAESTAWGELARASLDYATWERLNVNDGTGAARALAARARIMEAGHPPDRAFLKQVLRDIPGVSDAEAAHLLSLFESGDPNLHTALRAHFTGNAKKFWTLWRANLIGIPSEFANNAGNIITQGVELGDKAAASGVDWVISKLRRTGKRERFGAEVGAELGGMLNALPRALSTYARERTAGVYGRAWTGKERPIKVGTPLEHQVSPFGNKITIFGKSVNVPGLGKVGRLLASPLDALGVADDAAQSVIYPGELTARATRLAIQRTGKASGEVMQAEAQRILSDTVTHPERYTDLIKSATDAAQRRVYREKPWEIIQHLQQLERKYPWMAIVLPFVKTPANIARYSIRHLPVGLAGPEVFRGVRDFKAGKISQGELADIIAPRITGTVLFGIVAGMAKAGLITGGGPSDYKERRALLATGWQPYSLLLTIDDKRVFVPYSRFDPVSNVAGIAADLWELDDSKDFNDAVSRGVGTVMSNITNKTYLRGLGDLATAYTDPKQFLASYLTSSMNALTPSALDKLAIAIDPTFRDTRPTDKGIGGFPTRIAKTILSSLPFASSTLPARTTPTGEESERPGGRGFAGAAARFLLPSIPSTEKPGTELEATMARIHYVPGTQRPTLTISGVDVPLREAELAKFVEADKSAARELRRMLSSPAFQNLPDTIEEAQGGPSKESVIKKVYEKHRRGAREMLWRSASFRQYADRLVPKRRRSTGV
jgi:hypothetical protein